MGFPKWEQPTRCTSGPTPGALAFMRWFVEEYGDAGGYNLGIFNCRTIRGGATTSAHGEGRACDCGFPVGDPDGRALLTRLLPHVGALGIQAIIYERRIYSALSPAGRPYTGAVPHLDHLHIEFTREAAAHLTYATITDVMTPGLPRHRPGTRVLRDGMTGTDVRHVQRFLNRYATPARTALDVDGIYGPATAAAVRAWEAGHTIRYPALRVDGVVGAVTWRTFGITPAL